MASVVKVFRPEGVFTAHLASAMTKDLNANLEVGVRTVLVDLQQVHFMDSSGLGILTLMHTKTRLAGGRLYLCSLPEQVRSLLDIADMEGVFHAFANEAEFNATIVKKNQAVLVS